MGISITALAGCVDTVVHDEPSAPRNMVRHCQGRENVDASSVAAIPIPVVPFFSPHADPRNLKPEELPEPMRADHRTGQSRCRTRQERVHPRFVYRDPDAGHLAMVPGDRHLVRGPDQWTVAVAGVSGREWPSCTANHRILSGPNFHGCRRNQRSGPVSGSDGRGGVEKGEGAAKPWREPRSTLALGFLSILALGPPREIRR